VTWTAPQGFVGAATDGPAPADFDSTPVLVFDGAGRWLAAWPSNNSLGGTIGTDFDIFVSTGQSIVAVPALGGHAFVALTLMLAMTAARVLRRGRS
jgi:hypothetical protein